MSLPHELSTVCFQLLNTPSPALVQSLPELLRQVQRCQDPLSCSLETSTQGTAPAAVLVHKLKTVLSTFLNGRVPEQRFIAAVLIKAVVEVGGWEILRGCEAWVRGLLSVLAVRMEFWLFVFDSCLLAFTCRVTLFQFEFADYFVEV